MCQLLLAVPVQMFSSFASSSICAPVASGPGPPSGRSSADPQLLFGDSACVLEQD